jgi:CHAT domain-containing protein/tetratricopeptide (TPR) repeat protein
MSTVTHSSAAPGSIADELAQAQALHRNGSLQAARNAYQRALAGSQPVNDKHVKASALLGLAQIDLSQGRYAQCISEGNGAVAEYRTAHAPKDEGIALTAVGQARYFSGDSHGALADFESALRLSRVTNDRQAEITRLNNIGNVYFALGSYGDAFDRYRTALERLGGTEKEPWFASRRQLTNANLAVLYQGIGEYRRALQFYKEMGSDGKALPPVEQAQMLANMGTLYRRLGDPVTALETYRSAQHLYRTHALLAGELAVLNNIGIDYAVELRDYPRAIESFTHALQIGEKSGAKRPAMTSLLYRGETLLRSGKNEDAGADFASSRRIAEELGAQEEKWRSDYGLARVAAAADDLARSEELLRESIATIESMRRASSTAPGRSGFLIERRDVYDMLLEHLAGGPNPDMNAIFRLMEQGRARDLQDRMKARIATIEELRRRVPADTLIIEYWRGVQSLASIAISPGGAQLYFSRLTNTETSALQTLPNALADPKHSDWMRPARAAADVLLKDISALNRAGLRRIVIVPDADLGRIPFETLPDRDGLMIDRFTISYLPFASAFRVEAMKPRRWLAPWNEMMKGFADPMPGPRPAEIDLTSERPSDLPNASREVQGAAAALGGRSTLYIGREAKKAPLVNAAPGTPVLHFATHAFADLRNPDRSYVLFAGSARGFDYLFLSEAASLRAAEGSLVTVSACDSGSGQIERGKGIRSFGTAFLGAGARTVITSLWRVGDNPSAELMTRFYGFLASGDNASEALRKAKLAFRKSAGSASHPAWWAAFVLTGDRETTIPRVPSWALISAAALLTLVAVLFTILRVRKRAGMA